jgi:branched-chain amino acid transport system substrate-binding protein
MKIMTPGGERYFRPEDHQAVYNVPGGKVMKDPKYPIPVLGDLKIIPAQSYYRQPPFEPLKMGK